MIPTPNGERNPERQLRLWPGVVAVLLQWTGIALAILVPETLIFGVLGAVACGLIVLIWWAFFSRVPHFERWGGILLIVGAMAATPRVLLHPSIVGGMMGMMFYVYAIPVVSLALVVWAAATRRLPDGPRHATLVAAILLACGLFAPLRTNGITGDGRPQLAWRWTKTAEQQLLSRSGEPAALPTTPATPAIPKQPPTPQPAEPGAPAVALKTSMSTAPAVPHTATRIGGDWPGFRGPHRDAVITGVRIKTDWATSPPVELWRRPVGPAWSSFAVGNGLVYTQEQRGDFEVVSCYTAATGDPVWTHRDNARFYESNGGPGPRGTPTLHNGRIYTFGGTGILNALNAADGSVLWTRNAATDTGAKLPGWGYTSSPLVVDDLLIVATSGRIAAYYLATGDLRWKAETGSSSYSSPQLFTIDGVPQVVLMSGVGATSFAPADGTVLWKNAWPEVTIVQPAITADGALLISAGDSAGVRRLAVTHGPTGWTAKEVWTSTSLKPYFNDFVVHDGHAYGFDGAILACIDLQDGKRKWKGGRYGHGQMLLLSDQNVLLVLSEEGELALVSATPDKFTEIARFPAMEGKTWNHPVLAGDLLLVRNGEQMIAFRLSLAGS